jgi:hypothetical protein
MSMVIAEEYVYQWEIGLEAMARAIGSQMRVHSLTDWPELMWAGQVNGFAWELVFAWPEGMEP